VIAPRVGLTPPAIAQNAPIARTGGGVLPFTATGIVRRTHAAAFPILAPGRARLTPCLRIIFYENREGHFSEKSSVKTRF
jgi:hypothetical protein